MQKAVEKIPTWAVALFLVAVAIATHLCLIPVGMALHNSEWSSFLLVADGFRQGYRSAFPFQNHHGGLTLTFFRALFSAAWDSFFHGPWDHERGHMVFSYVFCPPLVALSSYYYLLRTYDRTTALLMGFVCAVGLTVWSANYGNEFYPLMLILGFLLMGLCAHKENPFFELTLPRLLAVGIISGHAIYATRASELYLVAFLTPWRQVPGWIRRLWASTLGKILFVFLASGVYLEIFGENLGSIAGHTIKLDGDPHFRMGMPLLALLWAWQRRRLAKDRNLQKRALTITAGLALGILPEFIHWHNLGKLWGSRIISTFDFPQSMALIGDWPQRIRSLASGFHHYRAPLAYNDQGVGQSLCLAFFLFAILFGLRKSKTSPKPLPLLVICAMNIYTFTRISVQTTEIGPVRYLLPMTPAIIGLMALVCHDTLTHEKKHFRTAVIFCLLCFTGHHYMARLRVAQHIRDEKIVENLHSIVESARKMGVSVVISNDYWMSNNLTVAAAEKPLFWASWNGWGPFEAENAARRATRAGILLKHDDVQRRPGDVIDLLDSQWVIAPVARLRTHDLYEGHKK